MPLTQTPGAQRSGAARPPVFFTSSGKITARILNGRPRIKDVIKKRSILVVDDAPAWHKLISRFLGGLGYKIYTAATCADGVKPAALRRPDCIVLDFHLSDGDAARVCLAIKAEEELKKIPVIIFSLDPCAEIAAYERCRAGYFLLKGTAGLEALPAAIEAVLSPSFSAQYAAAGGYT